jgi:predicted dehydrogenase
MGGFAGSHHRAILRLEESGHARLVCTCDPNPDAFGVEQREWRLAGRQVRVFSDYREMLESCQGQLDLVVIPTPIQMHAEMHAAAVSLGLAVYLEKPPTLDHTELEAMIATEAKAQWLTAVGFNFIMERPRLGLKQRLIAGEFGAVRAATLTALWPRPASYFSRNQWAGRLMIAGRTVLDSCFGNAMAHFVHNLLFWVGSAELFSWAQPAAVRAELYRAHAIEGADTFFVEADTASGITLRFALSHACAGTSSHCEMVLCERATLRYVVGSHFEIRWHDGRCERTPLGSFDALAENHLEFFRYLHGEISRPPTTLADSRAFVALNDLAHVSSHLIAPIPSHLVSTVREEKEQKDYLHVAGMLTTQENFLVRGIWPGASGWEREPGEVVTAGDLARFHETVAAMMKPQRP